MERKVVKTVVITLTQEDLNECNNVLNALRSSHELTKMNEGVEGAKHLLKKIIGYR